MQHNQRKYLTDRLVKLAKEKIEKINDLMQIESTEHNKINFLTKSDLMQYLANSLTFKGEPTDKLPSDVSNLFDLKGIREFVGKEPLFDRSNNNKIELINDYIYVCEKAAVASNKIKQKMILTIDEIMLGDSTKAVEAITKFEDFSV
ncbi:MAG: hypothetical protein CMC55_06640 [Flavobacteriaceae bacterium]|nr:hypothetical protein [Flavobacteriaceae bacterium]